MFLFTTLVFENDVSFFFAPGSIDDAGVMRMNALEQHNETEKEEGDTRMPPEYESWWHSSLLSVSTKRNNSRAKKQRDGNEIEERDAERGEREKKV